MVDSQTSDEIRLVRLPEILRRTGFCKSSIYNMVAREEFPKPRKVGRASVWPSNAFEDWLSSRAA